MTVGGTLTPPWKRVAVLLGRHVKVSGIRQAKEASGGAAAAALFSRLPDSTAPTVTVLHRDEVQSLRQEEP